MKEAPEPDQMQAKGEVIAVAFTEFHLNLIETLLEQESITEKLDVLVYNDARISREKANRIAARVIPFKPIDVSFKNLFTWYRIAKKMKHTFSTKKKKCLISWSLSHPLARSLAWGFKFDRINLIEDGVANYVPDQYIYHTFKGDLALICYRVLFSNFCSISKYKTQAKFFLLLNPSSKVKGSAQLSNALFWQRIRSNGIKRGKAHTDILIVPPHCEYMGDFTADIDSLILYVNKIIKSSLLKEKKIYLYCHPATKKTVNLRRLKNISDRFPEIRFILVENRHESFQSMMASFPKDADINVYSEASSVLYLALTLPGSKITPYILRGVHPERSVKRRDCFNGYVETLKQLGAKEL